MYLAFNSLYFSRGAFGI